MLAVEQRISGTIMSSDRTSDATADSLFRHEAILHHRRAASLQTAEVLRLIPRWQRHLFAAIAGCWIAGFVLLGAIEFDVSVNAPAIVRDDGLVEVTLERGDAVHGVEPVNGIDTVLGVEVAPGARVVRGQALVRFVSAADDGAAGAGATAVVSDAAGHHHRVLGAPFTGTVEEVWAVPGRTLAARDVALRMRREAPSIRRVFAFFPPARCPRLVPGAALTLSLDGERSGRHSLAVESVSAGAIAPGQLSRFAIDVGGLSTPLTSPVVVVTAVSPESADADTALTGGAVGTVTAVIGRERLLYRLFPRLEHALKRWLE